MKNGQKKSIKTEEHIGKEIRVLIVAPALPILGGQTVQAERLIDRFREVEGVCADLQPINPRFLPSLQKVKYVRTVVTTAKYFFDLLRRVPRYDIIHIFSASYFSFLLAPTPAVLAARLFGKKTILNYRSGEASDHLEKWRKTAVPTIRLFDKVVVPSGYLVDVFRQFGLTAQPVYNFVDSGDFRFRPRRPLRPAFLSNRNFEPLYNVSCTLRAFASIQQSVPEARLVVVGDGREREKLQRLAGELKLRDVTFAGRVPQERMPEYYDAADIYLNSPNIDNMPNSIIEAFSCGLPVVSTNSGGIPYIVEHGRTGILVDADDHAALADAAISLLKDDEFAQNLIEAARAECAKFSWAEVRDEWVGLYKELYAEGG